MSSIPTIDARSLDDTARPAVRSRADEPLASALGRAFQEFGFCAVVGHDIDDTLIAPAYAALRRFFALPEPVKLRYQQAGTGGARGYTPFRTEKAKDQVDPDLKEFWHVGRELTPEQAQTQPRMPRNVWPDEVPELRDAMLGLYRALDRLGARLLARLALDLGQPATWFDDKIDHGNSILRPLHYPPLTGAPHGVRSAAHEDINLITLMIAAGEPGLEILRRDGRWLPVETGPGQVIVNIGDMLQRLTNHVLPSTTHRVVNPDGAWGERSRYSLPFFLHPNPDFVIETLPSCTSSARPDRYPTPITADGYLQQRLREIGLL